VEIENKLDVSGIDVSNTLTVKGISTFEDNVRMENKLNVSILEVSNNLIVKGTATFKDNVIMNATLDLSNLSIGEKIGIGTPNPECPLQISTVGYSDQSSYNKQMEYTGDGITSNAQRYFNGKPDSDSGLYFRSIAMSHDGKRRTACVYGGYIYTSEDSGVNWISYSNISTPKNWTGIAMSSDGTIRVACTDGFSRAEVWKSIDGGRSWLATHPSYASNTSMHTMFRSIAMSDDGLIIGVVAWNDYIYLSSDTGKSWKQAKNLDEYQPSDDFSDYFTTNRRYYSGIAISRYNEKIIILACYENKIDKYHFNLVPTRLVHTVQSEMTLNYLSYLTQNLAIPLPPDGGNDKDERQLSIALLDSSAQNIVASYGALTGLLQHTTNGGTNWHTIAEPTPPWLSIGSALNTGSFTLCLSTAQFVEFDNVSALPSITDPSYLSINSANPLSIKTAGGIWVGKSVISASDSRIKTNIQDVPDNLALQQLRDIPCKYYEYKDKIERGSDKTIGFIAQEVKEIMPMAIAQEKQIIPDVYKSINCDWTLDNSDINNVKYKMSSTDLSNVSGIKYKFYMSNNVDPSKPFELSINNIDSNGEKTETIIGSSDNTFTFDNEYNNVFCYGKEVSDFHTLDKNKLFTLNFSATQEIDRIQQTHITEIDELKLKVTTLETKMTSLKTENAYLKTIVDKLTSATSFEDFKSKM